MKYFIVDYGLGILLILLAVLATCGMIWHLTVGPTAKKSACSQVRADTCNLLVGCGYYPNQESCALKMRETQFCVGKIQSSADDIDICAAKLRETTNCDTLPTECWNLK